MSVLAVIDGITADKDEAEIRGLRALHGLAQAYCCLNKYKSAENKCRKAMKGYIKVYGMQSPQVKRSLELLSFIMEMQGATERALAYADCALSIVTAPETKIDNVATEHGPSVAAICRFSRQVKKSTIAPPVHIALHQTTPVVEEAKLPNGPQVNGLHEATVVSKTLERTPSGDTGEGA